MIISISATTREEELHKCMEAGMDTSAEKPFKVDDLVYALNSLRLDN